MVSLTDEQNELIEKHLSLVIDMNEGVNLTRIDSPEEGRLLHIEDSLTGLEEVNSAPEGLYGDLGSGGGFPGIPLAIATGRKTVLIESRKRKVDALDSIIECLDLQDQISTYCGRAELLARKEGAQYSVLTARALSKLNVIMELASPLLKQGGVLVCYKANVDDDEYDRAIAASRKTAMKLVSDRSFTLSDGETSRRILAFEKSGFPTIKLPRQEGRAQKEPLT